jgi:hypothetical protein
MIHKLPDWHIDFVIDLLIRSMQPLNGRKIKLSLEYIEEKQRRFFKTLEDEN